MLIVGNLLKKQIIIKGTVGIVKKYPIKKKLDYVLPNIGRNVTILKINRIAIKPRNFNVFPS